MTRMATTTASRRRPTHAYCVPVVREMPRPLPQGMGDSCW
jgi:hypothetical protein